ncbi:MAG: cardiolipin synthase [Roseivirga sp.]|jgi:cardiolipin synthase
MFEYWFTLSPYFLGVYYLTVFAVAINMLLENRNPLKTHSYLLLLMLLPLLGLIIYLFFGQNIRKRRIFSKNQLINTAFGQHYVDQYLSKERLAVHNLDNIDSKFNKLISFLNRDLSPLTNLNRLTVLKNGEEKFPALVASLKEANHHIHIEYYIFSNDEIGNEISQILIEKARAGVEVRMIVDGVGSLSLRQKYFNKMSDAGVQLQEFMPVLFPSFTSKINYRNHRKIVVIDGVIGFTGGINIDDRYLNNGKHRLFWRDTHLKLEGEAVKTLQLLFILNWQFVTKKSWINTASYFPKVAKSTDDNCMQINASGPDWELASIMDSFYMAINAASQKIQIATPYFIPNESILNALITSAKSGVVVELMIPYDSDSWIVQAASESYIKKLLDVGIKVYRYKKGFLHSKTLTVDGEFTALGSANMDYRSFDLNHEVNAYIYDKSIAKTIIQNFEEDKKECIALEIRRWRRRSIWQKLLESVCRLLAPLL